MAAIPIVLSVDAVANKGLTGLVAAINLLEKLGVALKQMAERGDVASDAWEALSISIDQAKQATGGEVRALELAQVANRATQAGLSMSGQAYGTLAGFAKQAADATGGDFRSAAESIVQALASGRTRSLRQYGIDLKDTGDKSLNAALALKEMAKALAQTTGALDTAGDWVARTEAAWDDYVDAVSRSFSESQSLVGALDRVTEGLGGVVPAADAVGIAIAYMVELGITSLSLLIGQINAALRAFGQFGQFAAGIAGVPFAPINWLREQQSGPSGAMDLLNFAGGGFVQDLGRNLAGEVVGGPGGGGIMDGINSRIRRSRQEAAFEQAMGFGPQTPGFGPTRLTPAEQRMRDRSPGGRGGGGGGGGRGRGPRADTWQQTQGRIDALDEQSLQARIAVEQAALDTRREAIDLAIEDTEREANAATTAHERRMREIASQNQAELLALADRQAAQDEERQHLERLTAQWSEYTGAVLSAGMAAALQGKDAEGVARAAIAALSMKAGTEALMEAAAGVAALAVTWGVPNPSATGHFTAAGMYGAVALGAVGVGKAAFGSSFGHSSNGGGGAGGEADGIGSSGGMSGFGGGRGGGGGSGTIVINLPQGGVYLGTKRTVSQWVTEALGEAADQGYRIPGRALPERRR